MITSLALAAALVACSTPSTGTADLTWLSGTWRTTSESGYSEVTFGPQYKDQLSGVLRVVRSNGQTILLEMISIDVDPKGTVLRVRHLTADLEPRDPAPLVFRLIQICNRGATFANQAVDAAGPQKSTYWIDEKGRLRVLIEGVRGTQGRRSYESILMRVQ
jgi:Domain of unknown function (DUF6265)